MAETGDPRRFATGRAVVKHAGLAPREKTVRRVHRPDPADRPGAPGLRLAAWRAVWGAQRANPVYRARYQHLTSRDHNKLTPTQAQTVIAAAILRHLHAVITTGQAWDPVGRSTRHPAQQRGDSPPDLAGGPSSWRPGRALRGIETPQVISAHIMGSPARRLLNPITRCRDQPHNRYAGTDDGRGTGQGLTQTVSR